MYRKHEQEFEVLRVLEPALRMKAQKYCNSRGQKDFICREFNCKKEEKDFIWHHESDSKPGDSLCQGGECVL
jgi:hypothetical protein